MTKTERTLSELNGTLDEEYGAAVNRKIREKYNLSEELAILRQKEKDPAAFAAYDSFAEKCKAQARREVYGEEAAK